MESLQRSEGFAGNANTAKPFVLLRKLLIPSVEQQVVTAFRDPPDVAVCSDPAWTNCLIFVRVLRTRAPCCRSVYRCPGVRSLRANLPGLVSCK